MCTRTQEKGTMTPPETDPDLPVSVQESLVEAWVSRGLLQGWGHSVQQCVHGKFWRRSHYLCYLHHSLAPGQTTGREHSPAHQQKTGLKSCWARPNPSEQDSVSPSVSLSLQEASISLLSSSIRGQTEWKPPSQKTNQSDDMDQSCLTQWNYEPRHVGPPKIDESWWRVLTKPGPLEKGKGNHFSILVLEPHE